MDNAGAPGRFFNSTVGALTGNEKIAQAYKDYGQGVLSAVYAMSGKQTTNAEMQRFLDAYMPQAGDSAERIKLKTNRIKGMLRSIQGKVANGQDFDTAQAAALAAGGGTATENPAKRDLMKKYGLE